MGHTDFNDRLWRVYEKGRALTDQARDMWMIVLGKYAQNAIEEDEEEKSEE